MWDSIHPLKANTMKVSEAAMTGNQRLHFRQLGTDRNEGGISNTPLTLQPSPMGLKHKRCGKPNDRSGIGSDTMLKFEA